MQVTSTFWVVTQPLPTAERAVPYLKWKKRGRAFIWAQKPKKFISEIALKSSQRHRKSHSPRTPTQKCKYRNLVLSECTVHQGKWKYVLPSSVPHLKLHSDLVIFWLPVDGELSSRVKVEPVCPHERLQYRSNSILMAFCINWCSVLYRFIFLLVYGTVHTWDTKDTISIDDKSVNNLKHVHNSYVSVVKIMNSSNFSLIAIQWSPLVRSAFCPKKVDLTSGLTLYPGYNSV